VSDFSKYLQHPENRRRMSFNLRDGGYDTRDHQGGADAPERSEMVTAGWNYRRELARRAKFQEEYNRSIKTRDDSAIPQQSFPEDSKYPLGGEKSAVSPQENATGLPSLPPPANGPTTDPFGQHPEVVAADAAAPFDMAIGRYVLMPDHIHLFVRLDIDLSLAQWVRGLKRCISRSVVEYAPHWQEGFFDHLLRSKDSYSQKWEYVRQNPVRAGLTTSQESRPYQGEIVRLPFD
jgi:REP element-mobilizing transposase RayT